MKSFTTLAFAATMALTSAQVTYNQTTGKYMCALPNAAYCAGDSGVTNIIIRCDANGIGQPGNCNDNLDAEFPFGVDYSPCYEISPTSGEAACSKNCIVYGGSGTINGTFPIPGCIPTATQSTSSSAPSTVSASSSAATSSAPVTTVTFSYTTVTVPCNTTSSASIPPSTNVPPPLTTAPSSSEKGSTSIANSTTTGGGSGGNGGNGGNSGSGSSATATPVGPTKTSPSSFTGAAVVNTAGAVLAAAGILAAVLL